ncbi:MAG: TrmH family RNA methyltransferase [Desulfobacterales bacterium]|jgi:tRNA G18 (ribose-2'-O)-methylase SpoU
MGLRKIRRRFQKERQSAIRRFRKQKRLNLLASPGRHEFIIVLDHLKPFFNIGKIFRSADAFGAAEVHLIATDFFDPAPAKGSFKWVPAKFHADFASCYAELMDRQYTLCVMEVAGGEDLAVTNLPRKSAFIFGNEEFGHQFDKDRYPGIKSLKIHQMGQVESLNVSIAASIVMYEYVKQHRSGF